MIEGIFLLLITVALSIVGAAVASSLQQKAWEVQSRRSMEDAQLVRAQQLSDKFIYLADRRLYRVRRLLWSLGPRSSIDTEDSLGDYRKSVFEWNDNFGYLRANLSSLYGFNLVLEFEEEIHHEFQAIGAEIEALVRQQRHTGGSALHRRLDLLSKNNYNFTARLKAPIRDRKLPHFEDLDKIEYQNADRLPLIYLIKRLYGISTELRRV